MTKFKKLSLFLCLAVFLQLSVLGVDTKEEVPIKIKFQNESDHSIAVHVLADTMITSSQYLEPHMELEIDVAFGSRVRLDYKPKPRQTLLSQMGSLNELYRTVLIRNDGKTVFIQEKFSRLNGEKAVFIEREIKHFLKGHGSRRDMPPGLERTRYVLSRLNARPVYYVWFNKTMSDFR